MPTDSVTMANSSCVISGQCVVTFRNEQRHIHTEVLYRQALILYLHEYLTMVTALIL